MTITPANFSSQFDSLMTFFQSQAGHIQTALPVEVVAVNTAKRTVSLKSLICMVDNAGKSVEYGIMANVPYVRLQAGNYGIIIDPAVGDKGIAVFCSRDISNVRKSKVPASRRKHSISDGIYIASLFNAEPATFLKIKGDTVEIKAAKVIINADTTINGNVNINGMVTIPQDVVIGKDAIPFTQHVHKYDGGKTLQPIKSD